MAALCHDGAGAAGCAIAWIPTNMSECMAAAPATCAAAAVTATLPVNASAGDPKESTDGVAYGAALSIVCDIVIAIGLGLQKTGHMRLMKIPEEDRKGIFSQRVWILGLICMISGEVGNLLAYGDRNTPTAVVTSVGCVGVVANLFISTVFLKEPFRLRDVLGAFFVVCGVVLVTWFAPNNPVPLSGDRLNELVVQAGAITVYIVYISAIVFLYFAVKRSARTTGGTPRYRLRAAASTRD